MLQNSNRHKINILDSEKGFTLTELLVAMAIFVTLMGSLFTLFTGTVETTQIGYKRLATFETGRSIMEVMKRDLATSFSAREYGDYYQFYGQDNGFTFVGVNDSGNLSRISYAVSRVNNWNDFTGAFVAELGPIVRKAITQGIRNSPLTDTSGTDAKLLDGLTFAQNTVTALYNLGYIENFELVNPAQIDENLSIYTYLQNIKDEMILAGPAWGPGVPYPFTVDLNSAFLGPGRDDLLLEIDTEYQMANLIRYEEPGVSSMDSLPVNANLRTTGVSGSTTYVTKIVPDCADNVITDIIPVIPENATGLLTLLYQEELSAINFGGTDMRLYIPDARCSRAGPAPLQYINSSVVEKILRAERQSIWIEMLTNKVTIGNASAAGLNFWNPLQLDLDNFDDNVYNSINNNLLENRIDPMDYTVADHFVYRAIIRDVPGLLDRAGEPLDLYGNPDFFGYAQGNINSEGGFLQTFNSTENIFGYEMARTGSLAPFGTAEDNIYALDALLQNQYTGYKSESFLQGSPLTPRIPSLIRVQFWAARGPAGVGDPAIDHWFTEVVEIQAGMTRKAPVTIASSPAL